MANSNHICVYDFETGGTKVQKVGDNPVAEPLQIGALMLHPHTLRVVDTFEAIIKPLRPELVEEDALKVNNLTMEQVMEGVHPKIIWKDFVSWVKQYQTKDTPFNYPIPAGYNIDTFDKYIVDNLCEDYGPTSVDKFNGVKQQAVFHRLYKFDLMMEIWQLMENTMCLADYSESGRHDIKLTTLARYFDINFSDAHTALGDVYVTAAIIVRILKLKRSLIGNGFNGKTKFNKAFGGITAKEYLES